MNPSSQAHRTSHANQTTDTRVSVPDDVSASEPIETTGQPLGRRNVLAAAGAVGAVGVLAACGSNNPAPSTTPRASASEPDQAAGGQVVATTSDVPVGGGVVVDEKMIVVTQPKSGDFKAFTSTCPHQGCTVAKVTADAILCPCHGSQFSAETGDVLVGPATTGLTPVAIRVKGTEIIAET
ncbi:MAG: Rieske (2Fe-2S) protein [Candidatus Nanopelagicales bacterium]